MPSPPGTVAPVISSIARIDAPRSARAIRNSLPLFVSTTTSLRLPLATMPLRLNSPASYGIALTSSACGVPLPAPT